MINVPANIQYQLGDAVGVIADSDFWRRWETLVDVCTHIAVLVQATDSTSRIWYQG